MKVAISSGKGGTGKTFIAANLAAMAAQDDEDVVYLDCDVEEPNGHLFLKPEGETAERMTVRAPVRIDADKCTACGKCVKACHYNALALIKEKVLLFGELCHACGVCSLVCPEGAVVEEDKEIGELRHGRCGKISFHYGLLKTAAGGMSPRLIHALKQHAGNGLTILDSPPGTACSTVETVKEADLCVLAADPTPFAINDLKLSVNMCRRIGQEPAVVVNRAGLTDPATGSRGHEQANRRRGGQSLEADGNPSREAADAHRPKICALPDRDPRGCAQMRDFRPDFFARLFAFGSLDQDAQ